MKEELLVSHDQNTGCESDVKTLEKWKSLYVN